MQFLTRAKIKQRQHAQCSVASTHCDHVVQARDGEGKLVAVKALSLQSMSDWKQLDLFQREASTLKQLQHPGIPQYVADFEEDTEKDRGYFLVQVSHVGSRSCTHCHGLSPR